MILTAANLMSWCLFEVGKSFVAILKEGAYLVDGLGGKGMFGAFAHVYMVQSLSI